MMQPVVPEVAVVSLVPVPEVAVVSLVPAVLVVRPTAGYCNRLLCRPFPPV